MAYVNVENWTPTKKSKMILDRAFEHIKSVPYKVSARWVFYRLLQDGIYTKKSDYKNTFIGLTSRARHSGYWSPDLLADETREAVIYEPEGTNKPNPDIEEQIHYARFNAKREYQFLENRYLNYEYNHDYQIDPTWYLDNITVVMFEARAMKDQFKRYAKDLTLCPFGGQPSIPYKYELAKYLEDQKEHYNKPILVLYFGDYDEAGQTIFNTAREDIGKWCEYGINWQFCGLTKEQAIYYQIPENIDHKGFQWEALTDPQAKEIITSSIKKYTDIEKAKIKAIHESREIRIQVNEIINQEIKGDGPE
jgi:hypothetical protein